MQQEWIANPLTHYGLLTTGLSLCLYLFISIKRDVRLLEYRRRKQQEAWDAAAAEFRAALEEIRTELREAEERSGAASLPPGAAGINLNKRSQALRMFRRGARPDQIASALAVPQNEVELLLKLHQAVHQ